MFQYTKFFDDRDTFPYWKYVLPDPRTMFNDLKAEKLDIRLDERYPVLFRTYPGDHRKTDGITDYFTEYARIDASFKNMKTPRGVWEDMERSGTRFSPSGAVRPGEAERLRERVYESTRECSNFNVALALWIIRTSLERNRSIPPHAFKILDPSAGWGDRMIAALAAGIGTYTGFDPNRRLQRGYEAIIGTLGGSGSRYSVTPKPFEGRDDPALADESFDLVLTSPPYFTMEDYEPGRHRSEQSINRYPTFGDWVKNMYQPYLAKAWKALKVRGTMAVSVENVSVAESVGTRSSWVKYRLADMTRDIVKSLGGVELDRFGIQTLVAGVGGGTPSQTLVAGVGGGTPSQTRVAKVGGGNMDSRPRWTYYWVKSNM